LLADPQQVILQVGVGSLGVPRRMRLYAANIEEVLAAAEAKAQTLDGWK
jgi:hypothetical protein